MEITSNEKIMKEILESLGSVMVIDAQSRIVYVNHNYQHLLGLDHEESVIGKHVKEVIPNSNLPRVLETGKEDIGVIWQYSDGKSHVINRLPIKEDDGTVIGAIGLTTFEQMADVGIFVKEIERLRNEINTYKNELGKLRGAKYSLDQIIGENSAITKLKKLIQNVASTKSTVLISGETGTGKELFAHAIHEQSNRKHTHFIRVNCASIPKDLLESELFGYEEGAFTGAKKGGKPGKFELANGGSILLDEIDQLPLYLQSKLLRVIQERELDRVGSIASKEIDVRLICTSNKDLLELVRKGDFREDLFYRINVVNIRIPPLRERMDDLDILTEQLIKKINRTLGLHIEGVSKEVMILFKAYDWPGNIRELEHILERAANYALTGILSLEHVDLILYNKKNTEIFDRYNSQKSPPEQIVGLDVIKARAEKEAIIHGLIQTKGNKKRTAELLKMDRSVLYEKIKKYNIHV